LRHASAFRHGVLRLAQFRNNLVGRCVGERSHKRYPVGQLTGRDAARQLLGCAPRWREDAIVATAESLMRLGLLEEKMAA
jgi:hypothetical protein